jgi:hypothetical protein
VAVDGANGSPWLHIECKRGKRCSIMAAIRQAVADSDGTGRVPIAVVREDRRVAVAVMRDGDFDAMDWAFKKESGRLSAISWSEEYKGETARPDWRPWMYESEDGAQFNNQRGEHFVLVRWDVLVSALLAPLWRATK